MGVITLAKSQKPKTAQIQTDITIITPDIAKSWLTQRNIGDST